MLERSLARVKCKFSSIQYPPIHSHVVKVVKVSLANKVKLLKTVIVYENRVFVHIRT